MWKIGVLTRTLLAVVFTSGGVACSGSACIAGIAECTNAMRSKTSEANDNVYDVCRSMESYMLCIKRHCSTFLTPCDVRIAGNRLTELLNTHGYTCNESPEVLAFEATGTSPDEIECSQSHSASLSSASSTRLFFSSNDFTAANPILSLIIVVVVVTIVQSR